MILTPEQMRAAEEGAFARGVRAEDLMEVAGGAVAEVLMRSHSLPGICHVFFGKGNNGGDALVAGRVLASRGWTIVLHPAADEDALGSMAATQLAALRAVAAPPRSPSGQSTPVAVIDGLLGIGASGAPRGRTADLIRAVNAMGARGARVVAVDVPSGLDPATGVPSDPVVCAGVTVTMGCVKTGLLADTATGCVGEIEVVALEGVSCSGGDAWRVAVPELLARFLPPRPFDTHKGHWGRIGLVAGSPGYTGAARLCSSAAVRAGAGLVTLCVPADIWPVLAASCAPEVMVRPVRSPEECLHLPLDVLAVGPGLGRERDREVLALVRDFPGPCVVDADALNALAGDLGILRKAAGPRLLTPHPGEMERLDPQRGRTRRQWASDFATTHTCHLILKGARSIACDPDGNGIFNTTGNPGMASGGMGDVLTGTAAALCAQTHGGISAAAALAMWICGKAADLALQKAQSHESLCAGDVCAKLGAAFQSLGRHSDLPAHRRPSVQPARASG
jgi:ADP-dependent NAD(P)H-hydrate dehydratase / NAD(P)H-hydrate epimerase